MAEILDVLVSEVQPGDIVGELRVATVDFPALTFTCGRAYVRETREEMPGGTEVVLSEPVWEGMCTIKAEDVVTPGTWTVRVMRGCPYPPYPEGRDPILASPVTIP